MIKLKLVKNNKLKVLTYVRTHPEELFVPKIPFSCFLRTKSQEWCLWPYDQIRKCLECHPESSYMYNNWSRKTLRPINSIFQFFWGPKVRNGFGTIHKISSRTRYGYSNLEIFLIFIVEVFFITWIYEIRERMWQYQHDERYGEWYDSFLRSQTEWDNLKPILCQLMSVYHRISQHDEENFLNWNYQSIYILLTVILTCSKTNFYDL